LQRKVTKTERYGISNRVATSKAQAKRENLQRLATVERNTHQSEDADLPMADEEVQPQVTILDH
jgi:hypothetical protein